jgi:hypothetical protein
MSEFFPYLTILIKNLLSLWWLWAAILLYAPAKFLLIWTLQEIKYWSKINWILLEIKIPEEITKTPKAAENIFHAIWPLYDPPANFRDYWFDGKWTPYYSLEIVGRRGKVHFFIRTPSTHRSLVENAIYAEYPNAEVTEAEDYVKKFGNLPNEEYEIWGADQRLIKPDVFPIKTYQYWDEEIFQPERRLDPMAVLLESLTGLEEGEELWIQIKASPASDEIHPYIAESKDFVNLMMNRPMIKKTNPLDHLHITKAPGDIISTLAGNPIPEREAPEKETSLDFGQFKLSPGESDQLRSVEENLAKYVYETNIRFIYVGKRDVFLTPRGVGAIVGYFNQFSTVNLNGLAPDKTKSKVAPWFFEKRRLFAKKRKIYKYYADRMWPWHRKPYLFSTSELATIFHFPAKELAPAMGVSRVPVKKGGSPHDLPE